MQMTDYACWGESELIGRIMELEREARAAASEPERMILALCRAHMAKYGAWPEGAELDRMEARFPWIGGEAGLEETIRGMEKRGIIRVWDGLIQIND